MCFVFMCIQIGFLLLQNRSGTAHFIIGILVLVMQFANVSTRLHDSGDYTEHRLYYSPSLLCSDANQAQKSELYDMYSE